LEGNIIGTATFPSAAKRLLITSSVTVEQHSNNPFDFILENRAVTLPVTYSNREYALLAPFLGIAAPESVHLLSKWMEPFLTASTTSGGGHSTLDVITAMNRGIAQCFRYSQRHEHGVQSPRETIASGEGTCRDFAQLAIEAVRFLGIAARYVSGYLCSSAGTAGGESHTHGWCEFYLPGAGWRGFDPTNGILADVYHVPVSSSVNAGEIPPVQGSYCGAAGECIAHDVTIVAAELQPWEIN
jgi:transglutaminase-like putative cysteine protease